MKKKMECKYCGSNKIEYAETGIFCESCGYVLEESSVVNQIEFNDNNQTVGTLFGPFSAFKHNATASREQALSKGTREITRQTETLGINKKCAKAATRILELAINENFLKGLYTLFLLQIFKFYKRKKNRICYCCMYIYCL